MSKIKYLDVLLLFLFNYGKSQYHFVPEKSTFFGSINPFKMAISPNVGKSQVNFYSPPDIPQPDIFYQRVTNGRTDLKYRLNVSEAHHSTKVLFTIRNLGQNNTALANGIQKTAIDSSNQQQTIANLSRESETEMEISVKSSTTETTLIESMENKNDEATEVPIAFPYAPQESLVSSDNNELQQQHTSSTFPTFFLTSTVSTSTQHQTLVSSYPMDTKQPEAKEYEPPDFSITYVEQPYFTTTNAIIIHNSSSSEQQVQTGMPEDSVPQGTILSLNITSEQTTSNFVSNAPLSSATTKKQKTNSFFETQKTSERQYESHMLLETSTHIIESYAVVSTNTESSMTVETEIPMNLPTLTTEPQGSALNYPSDNHEANISGNTKNFSGTVDRNNSLQIEKNLIQPIDVLSSYGKQLVKPRIQSLLPFHFPMRNGTIVYNNVSSSRQISSKQETVSKSFTYFNSDTDKSDVSSTLEVTTHEQTFAPTTITSEGLPVLVSDHSLLSEEVPNITDEKKTLGDFGQEADELRGTSNSEQQLLPTGGNYPEKQHSFSDLDPESSSSDIAETDEQNSQTNHVYLTNVHASNVKEEAEHGEVLVQLGDTDIFEQEQINKTKMSSDLHPSSTDASGISNGTTYHNTTVSEMESDTFKEIHEIKHIESSSPSNESSIDINSQFIPNNEIASSNKDEKEVMLSVFPRVTNGLPPTLIVTTASILAGIHRTEMPVKKTTNDNHATPMKWYTTSSMKLGESSQRVILPISELKGPDASSLTPETNIITKEEPSKTIHISASTSPAIALIPSSVPLSVVIALPSAVTSLQHERTITDHLTVEKSSKVQPPYVDGEPSEGLRETVSNHPEEIRDNDWNSQFKTEVSPSEISNNDLPSGTADEIKNSGTSSSYANNFAGHEDNSNYGNHMTIDSIRDENSQNITVPDYQSSISQGSVKVNVLQHVPKPLPQQMPNPVKFPYTAQPFNSKPYQPYIAQKAVYTGWSKGTVQSIQPLSASVPMFGLGSGSECCSDRGGGNGGSGYQSCCNGFFTSCSSYCSFLPCCCCCRCPICTFFQAVN